MDTTNTLLRSARHFFSGTLLSRFTGLVRDIAMAFCFGSAPEIAAFMVAYRLANLFRRLFGEGNLQAGFTPHFEAAKGEGERRAALFYRNITSSLVIVLLLAVLFLEGVFWGVWEFAGSDWKEIAELCMYMAPGLIFICLYALNSAFLQCERSYFVPAAAPIFFNLIWVCTILAVWHLPKEEAVRWVAVSVTGAFFGQWLVTLFVSQQRLSSVLSLRDWFRPQFFSADWKKLLKPLTLGMIGIGATQINAALDAIFARIADPSGPAYLWYAIRIQQLPLALFGIALSGALLPPLSRALQSGDFEKYRNLLRAALRYSIALILPCVFGLFALGGVGLNLLYGHGDFIPADVQETLFCLWAYGLGLIPSVLILLLAGGLYAQKSYRIPTLASLLSVVANVGLNAFFVLYLGWGAVSIAVATSCSAWLNAIWLAYKIGEGVIEGEFYRFFLKMSLICAFPTLLIWSIEKVLGGPSFTRVFFWQVAEFGIFLGIYVICLLLLTRKLNVRELLDLYPS